VSSYLCESITYIITHQAYNVNSITLNILYTFCAQLTNTPVMCYNAHTQEEQMNISPQELSILFWWGVVCLVVVVVLVVAHFASKNNSSW